MSQTNNDSFKTEMLAEIKRIQTELNELKNIKENIVRKPAKKTVVKKKVVKRKPAKKTVVKKKVVKRKPAKKTTRRR